MARLFGWLNTMNRNSVFNLRLSHIQLFFFYLIFISGCSQAWSGLLTSPVRVLHTHMCNYLHPKLQLLTASAQPQKHLHLFLSLISHLSLQTKSVASQGAKRMSS